MCSLNRGVVNVDGIGGAAEDGACDPEEARQGRKSRVVVPASKLDMCLPLPCQIEGDRPSSAGTPQTASANAAPGRNKMETAFFSASMTPSPSGTLLPPAECRQSLLFPMHLERQSSYLGRGSRDELRSSATWTGLVMVFVVHASKLTDMRSSRLTSVERRHE